MGDVPGLESVATAMGTWYCRSSWIGDYKDPNTFLDMFISNSGNNRTGWTNAAYDALVNRANADRNPERRFAILRDAERLLVEEEMPIIPLFFYTGINYFDDRQIKGVYNNILDVHPLNAIEKVRRLEKVAAKP